MRDARRADDHQARDPLPDRLFALRQGRGGVPEERDRPRRMAPRRACVRKGRLALRHRPVEAIPRPQRPDDLRERQVVLPRVRERRPDLIGAAPATPPPRRPIRRTFRASDPPSGRASPSSRAGEGVVGDLQASRACPRSKTNSRACGQKMTPIWPWTVNAEFGAVSRRSAPTSAPTKSTPKETSPTTAGSR